MKTHLIIKLLFAIIALRSTMIFAATTPPPTVIITAKSYNIMYNTSGTITWSSTNASSCIASGGWSGSKSKSGTYITPALTLDTSYTITCTGKGGTQSASLTIYVQSIAANAPVVTFTASPISIPYNGSTKLTWTSLNASACTASGGWSGNQALSGSVNLTALLSTTTYTLQCSGPGGPTTQSVTVKVALPPPPTLALSAAPASIAYGGTSVITWNSAYATSCVASGGWADSQALSGTFTTPTLTSTSSYTLTCTGLSGAVVKTVNVAVAPPPPPSLTLNANPSSIANGSTSNLTWSSSNATACVASDGWTGSQALSGTYNTPVLNSSASFTLTCTGLSGSVVQTATITVTPPLGNAGSRLGINMGWVNDWGDRDLTFIDVMKQARGFATIDRPWDPTNYPVPLDVNGWPTTDFGVTFISNAADPLGRPLTSTFPSMFGTYQLSFTGQAIVKGYNCCLIQNAVYNPATNTTTADVIVQPNDDSVTLTFNNTVNGVENLQLLRPGYALGTPQIISSEFLNAVAPFSTIRVMEPLLTNGNPATTWATRKLATDPTQQGPLGIAWEYVIEVANASGKDIWINIPGSVDLNDPSNNNYVVQLATLIKNTLHPGIHVYVEYSNELWNGAFSQSGANMAAAIADVTSGADPSLNYDNGNNQWYWGYRRAAHQTLKISQLFAGVFGPSVINDTIRPVYMSQYAQPYIAEDALAYLNANFGSPNQYLYGIGGAPYFTPTSSYTDVNSLFTSLISGLNSVLPGFSALPAYNGGIAYSGIQYKNIATYYGLKSLMYEGGPDLTAYNNSIIDESAESDSRINQLVQAQLADFLGCGNDLFVYYKLAAAAGDVFGAYEDLTVTTEKSRALNTVAATPLANYTVCTSVMSNQLYIQ